MMLSDVCLSVAYIGPKSRTERPRATKIGTEVAHVTLDSDTTFKFKRSRSHVAGHIVAVSRLQFVFVAIAYRTMFHCTIFAWIILSDIYSWARLHVLSKQDNCP